MRIVRFGDGAWAANPREGEAVLPREGMRVKTKDSTVVIHGVQFEGESRAAASPSIGTRFATRLATRIDSFEREVKALREIPMAYAKGFVLLRELI